MEKNFLLSPKLLKKAENIQKYYFEFDQMLEMDKEYSNIFSLKVLTKSISAFPSYSNITEA